MSVFEENIANLDTIVVGAKDAAPAVVLLHGFGAHYRDLFPLHQMLRPQMDCAWYFPNGPVRVFTGMPEDGRAWFPLDVERLTMLASQQDYNKVAAMDYNGMDQMTARLQEFLSALQARHDHIIIGGFSQGAMLATNLALTTNFPLLALTLFSGSIAKCHTWEQGVQSRSGLPVFQSHGRFDPVLPFELAERLRDLMMAGGLALTFQEFPGMHEIPYPVLTNCRSFLDSLIQPLGD
jgi:phospholipase/carboxylesterase